jgi:uncharacterized membrane protein YbhN (UPF0104 family)
MEAFIILSVIRSFSIPINLVSSLFVLCVVTFSMSIPSGPASIGLYQYGYIVALSVTGVADEVSLAISVVHQCIEIIIVCSTGLYFMWNDHILLKGL